jgi:hypothetical protein
VAAAVWVLVFLTPTLLSESAPNFLRSVGIFPAVVLFPALGLDLVVARLSRSGATAQRPLSVAVALAVFGASGCLTVKAYFQDYPDRLESYLYLNGDYVDAGVAVRDLARTPNVYLDAYFARHSSVRYQLRDRLYHALDSRRTLVIPAGEAEYFLPRIDPTLTEARIATLVDLTGGERREVADSRGRPLLTHIRKPAAAAVRLARAGMGATNTPTFADALRLLGAFVGTPAGERAAGAPLAVNVAWEALKRAPPDTVFSLRVYDEEGLLWAQLDEAPASVTHLASDWSAGDAAIDQFRIPLPADQPPGRYEIALSVYTRGERNAWPVRFERSAPSDEVALASFEVTEPSPLAAGAITPQRRQDARLYPGLALIGHSLGTSSVPPAQPTQLHLYWRADGVVGERLRMMIRWLDVEGQIIGSRTVTVGGAYPTDRWRPGVVLHQAIGMAADKHARAGPSRFRIDVVGDRGAPGAVELTGPALVVRDRRWDSPADLVRVDARLGDLAELVGYRLPTSVAAARAGQSLDVHLAWRAVTETDTHYVVFVQILDGAGRLIAQADRAPGGGAAPSRSWLAGEVIEDTHTLQLPARLGAGGYRLIAGLYEPGSGTRLAASDGADFVELGAIRIAGAD